MISIIIYSYYFHLKIGFFPLYPQMICSHPHFAVQNQETCQNVNPRAPTSALFRGHGDAGQASNMNNQ